MWRVTSGSTGEASFEVNHAEHTENNADNDQPRDNGTGLFV